MFTQKTFILQKSLNLTLKLTCNIKKFQILYCDFSANSSLPVGLTGVDAIIFDIGLFHSLWGNLKLKN